MAHEQGKTIVNIKQQYSKKKKTHREWKQSFLLILANNPQKPENNEISCFLL